MIENTPAAVEGAHGIAQALSSSVGNGSRPEDIIGVLIPIVSIVLGIGAVMLGMYLDYRKKREIFELHHKERMAAIEKGMEVPPLPLQLFERSRRRPLLRSDYLRRGLSWLLIGIAISYALSGTHQPNAWMWGLVPVAIGLSSLLFYYLQGRSTEPGQHSE
jgi:cadmium resistance protein CadD (predicted permease)